MFCAPESHHDPGGGGTDKTDPTGSFPCHHEIKQVITSHYAKVKVSRNRLIAVTFFMNNFIIMPGYAASKQ